MNAFDNMLARYKAATKEEKNNALREVMQQVVLAGLARSDFFEKAAFYGGTCLRLLYDLPRFSEDMDFSLLKVDENFDLQNYFPYIKDEFLSMGKSIELYKKEKRQKTNMESAFLKSTSQFYDVKFQTEKQVKIKIEIDTVPPLDFETENKLLLQPFSFNVRCFTLPCLFAGKMHAFLFRNWKARVKGRDWFDFEWYVQNQVSLSLKHFIARAAQFGDQSMKIKNEKLFKQALTKRIKSVDVKSVLSDVLPFLKNPKNTEIWSTDYFLELVRKMECCPENGR
ncbi:MAG: nucleotidyl transferase AbiEii/AbiGii toxin family protein [Fibromonadaceae bacterium]|jgi:predicted nucleotidyltransferase component of viral defense system|nr:nucleotidyl transferase AbiEii/AbiGii toxin family protein [Fibromonadaceae bacterium]